MSTEGSNQQHSITPQDQYKEVAEDYRHHNTLIWQIPTLAGTLGGAVVISAFSFDLDVVVRSLILGVAFVLTLSLLYALLAHRHWADVRRSTLRALEDAHAEKLVHWGGSADVTKLETANSSSPYWYPGKRPCWYHWKAANVFVVTLATVLFVQFALLVYTVLQACGYRITR